ncbi:LysR substrate-binding domain-containing protein [Collimonas silvisoli]|uniref:LysR substrate-binding domain-containing protein n=1 Tax=Collimonas silvisoli TaxID=2825884 RepID=UPI001B8AB1A2|nr:LysR substrate-binding domain-containing protein [Collimonas silvisoli]
MLKQAPLNALRFFEAAARLGSFVQAADELHLTHGAVSRQIRLLEESLGIALFERRNRAVFLTPQGEQLFAATQQAFERLSAVMEALQKPARNAPLVVSCEPTVSMKWLIPRLGDFYRRHPDIQLHIFAAGGPVAFQRDGVDVALRRNDFSWGSAVHAKKVCDEWIGPVCAPALIKRQRLDLSKQKLLHTSSRKTAWPNWSKSSNTEIGHTGSQTYEHFYLSLQAACAGLGVAIGSAFMVQEEIDSGRLVAPFGFVRDGSEYFLLSSAPIEDDPRRTAFLNWIRRQMRTAAN